MVRKRNVEPEVGVQIKPGDGELVLVITDRSEAELLARMFMIKAATPYLREVGVRMADGVVEVWGKANG